MAVPGPYLPIDGRPMRMSLGLRPLDLDHWLEVDDAYAADLDEKGRLLRERHGEVVAHLPAGWQAASETQQLVRRWMAEHHPTLAPTVPAGLHPVDAAGRLVQEDLCVLTRDTGRWVLTAASVCAPSRWRLAQKVGATVAEIHAPVPGYEPTISSVVDRNLDRLAVQRPLWRLNWTLLDDPALFQPDAAGGPRLDPEAGLEQLTLRVERQTLRRLPRTDAVLFTIRTYRANLAEVAADPTLARDLAATLRTCPADLAAYKGWQGMLGWLVDTLERHPDFRVVAG